METTRGFRQLLVWQKAHQFVLSVYRLTEGFPKSDLFGMTSQLRRAATSIPANIAEGYARFGRADKIRFLNIAQGSLEESRYYLILAQDLGYGETLTLQEDIDEVARLLGSYVKGIQIRT